MKITIEFDTDSENYSRSEFLTYTHAIDLVVALNKIQEQCRTWYKYDERTEIPDEEIRDTINGIINDYVNMEELGY